MLKYYKDIIQKFVDRYEGPKDADGLRRLGIEQYHSGLKLGIEQYHSGLKQDLVDAVLSDMSPFTGDDDSLYGTIVWLWDREADIRQDYESGWKAYEAQIELLQKRVNVLEKANRNLIKRVQAAA